MGAMHAGTTLWRTARRAPGIDGGHSLDGRSRSGTPTPGSRRLWREALWMGIVALVALARVPLADAAPSDHRVPWLRGIQAITMSVNVIVDGGGKDDASPCRLGERVALERHGAEMLHGAGLDAIGAMDKLDKLRALHLEFSKALDGLEKAPPGAKPLWDREQSELRIREGDALANQPVLFVRIGVATIDGGQCAAGLTTDLRAIARERPFLNYNNEQVFAPLDVWSPVPLAFAVPPTDFEHAVTERLDIQVAEFIAAWRTANGQ